MTTPIDIVREELERLRMDLATVTAERDRLRSHSAALARLVEAHTRTGEALADQPSAARGAVFAAEMEAWKDARELLKESGT